MKYSGFLKLIFKFVLGIISICFLLEGAFRIFDPETIVPAHTTPAFGNPNAWKKNITYKAKSGSDQFFQVTINKNHFRNLKDYPYEKPEKTIRIMGLGRSVMMGQFVSDNETFGYFLEKTFNDRIDHLNFEFLNLGKGGWDLINQFVYLKNEGFKYSPDLIILFRPQNEYHYLDIGNVDFSKIRYKRENSRKVKVFLEGIKPNVKEVFLIEKLVRQLDRIPFYFELTKVSQFLHKVRKKLSALWTSGDLKEAERKKKFEKFITSQNLKESDEIEWIIENVPFTSDFKAQSLFLSQFIKGDKSLAEIRLVLYQWFLNRLIDFAKANGAKVLVVETPRSNQVLDIVPFSKKKSFFPSIEGAYIYRSLSDLISFQKTNDIMLLFSNDVHFTPAGNNLMAKQAYNFILENRLFEELKLTSKIDLLSSEVLNSIRMSNRTIQDKIDESQYSFYLTGLRDIENKRYDDAEKNLSTYLEASKNDQAKFLLCYAYFENKKYLKAASCFRSVPKYFLLATLKYKYLAEIYLKIEEPENALMALREWKEQFPLETKGSSDFHYLKAKSFWQKNEISLAELNFKIASSKAPKNYLIASTLGLFYFKQQQYENAIRQYQLANALKPEDPASYLFLSLANFKIGNENEGNDLIKKFVWMCKSSCEEILRKENWSQN